MKFKIIISCLLMMFFIQNKAQSLIDLSKDEVEDVIKKERKDLSKIKVVNKHFNYLKFEDRKQDQTLIVFFTEENIFKFSKSVYDYSLQDEVIKNLNTQHKKVGDYEWKSESTEITLTKQEWYFTVREEKK